MAISEFLEPAIKDYAEQAKATYSAPIDTSQFASKVAGLDPMQTRAADMATQGVGSYQPFLTAAQTAESSSQRCTVSARPLLPARSAQRRCRLRSSA